MVLSRQSVDDINLDFRLMEPLEKRARSSSPVKQRRHTQDWSSLARSADGSLDKLFSTTSLSHDQLIQFSNSDISERLHISKSGYAIPIPFQIHFPPRLRKPPTSLENPEGLLSADAPPKLIFTGLSYEPVSPRIAVSPKFEQEFTISRPPSPEKPPSVIASRKKVSAFVKNTQSDAQDQLSMIEEMATTENCRSLSHESKDLPIPPESNALGLAFLTQSLKPNEPLLTDSSKLVLAGFSRASTILSDTGLSKNGIHLPYDCEAPGEHLITENHDSSTAIFNSLSKCTLHKHFPQRDISTKMMPSKDITNTATGEHQSKLPDNFSPQGKKSDRREFSNESKVSSVSSLGSMGDVFGFRHVYMLSPNSKGDVRVSKHLVDSMIMGNSGNEREATSSELMHSSSFLSNQNQDSQSLVTVTESDKDAYDGPPKGFRFGSGNLIGAPETPDSKSKARNESCISSHDLRPTTPDEEIDTAPLVIQKFKPDKETEKVPDDNIGAGIGFHFPNNISNATNSNMVKSKVRVQRQRTRDSARSSIFSDGKIEIPDLDDEAFWKSDLYTGQNQRALNKLEVLNVSPPAIRKNSKTILKDRSFDSDSDSSFNSQFSKLNSQNKTMKNPSLNNPPCVPSTITSPVRHSRHRSMYNIDFDCRSIKSPQKNHHRSKSNAYVDSRSLTSSRLAYAPQHSRRCGSYRPDNVIDSYESTKKQDLIGNFEDLDITVNEPPKRVSYAVDFKAGDALPNPNVSFDTQPISHSFYPCVKRSQKLLSHSSLSQCTPGYSQDASSYRSSKTSTGTESTAPTEPANIIIDLTEEKYNVCVVNRNDSTTSYKSTTEKTKDGRNVEVVLVEEDEESNQADFRDIMEERDDLLSIYSTYLTSWGERPMKSSHQNRTIPIASDIGRESSIRSVASESSNTLAQSWAASSESNFHVKSIASVRREQAYMTKLTKKPNPPIPSLAWKATTKSNTLNSRDTNHFDYSSKNAYDFNSYMKQQSER